MARKLSGRCPARHAAFQPTCMSAMQRSLHLAGLSFLSTLSKWTSAQNAPVDRSNHHPRGKRLHLDQAAIKNWIFSRADSDHLLWRYLRDRPGTSPDPAPDQHLRRLAWADSWYCCPWNCAHPVRRTGRLADHAGILLPWRTFYTHPHKRLLAMGQEADDEEALGSGDVILVTILGFIVGWPLIWLCLLYGILLGGLVSLLLILWLVVSGKYKTSALMTFIPYGPYFITTAALIVYFPKLLAMSCR